MIVWDKPCLWIVIKNIEIHILLIKNVLNNLREKYGALDWIWNDIIKASFWKLAWT